MIRLLVATLALLTQLQAGAAGPATDNSKAIRLIDEMEAIYRGDASRATIEMKIETPDYQRSLRMEAINLGTENSLIRILEPRKDRGIATLKLDNEMWNYFPKINKVIKIPPSMMMGSWMGSDFTNDDLVQQTKLTDEYDLSLSETEIEYRITLVPKSQTITVWGKIDYTIDKKLMTPSGQNYYDDNGVMVRRLVFKDPVDFDGKLIPSVLEMEPLNKAGHKTIIVYQSLVFDPPDVSADDFTLRTLKSRF